jgi:AcrR family transcriptional regulator
VTATGTAASTVRARRRYDNTLRRERAGETRERIVAAGAELLRASSIRDWNALTIRAVAERAGVHERTVYRHFANERALRDAVMHRLEQDAGVDLAHMRLEDVADVTARTLQYVSAYRMQPRPPLDPTLDEARHRQHDALVTAVGEHTARWSTEDRRIAAAMLDVLWAVGSYERLLVDWELDRDEAIRGITWVIGLVEETIRENRPPTAARRAPRTRAGAARRAAHRGRE